MRADLERVPTPKKLRMRRVRKWIGIAATVLLVAGGAVALYRYLTRYQLSATDTIVIADLTNKTSDAVLDDALNLALPVEIAQTPFLQVLAQDKVRESMRQLNHPQDGKVTPEIAREVCLKTNSKAVVRTSGLRYPQLRQLLAQFIVLGLKAAYLFLNPTHSFSNLFSCVSRCDVLRAIPVVCFDVDHEYSFDDSFIAFDPDTIHPRLSLFTFEDLYMTQDL